MAYKHPFPGLRQFSIYAGHKTKVSNSGQLFFRAQVIMILETSTSSLSFRSSELSQPSEVLSS
jgi:hypothetical protein